jgi:cell division protein FtsQ
MRPVAPRSRRRPAAQDPAAWGRGARGSGAAGAGGRRPRRGPGRPPVRPVSPDRYRRRRLAAALIGLLLVVGLGLTGWVLVYDSGLADVEDVRVTGAAAVPVATVVAAAAVPTGGPLAAVDTDAVADRVGRLPGVASVSVARNWPHTVSVEVVERVPVAVTQTPQGLALVDRTGVAYPGEPAPELPRLLIGTPGPQDPATMAAIAVLDAVPDPVRAQVLTVEATVAGRGVPGQVTLGLTGDRQVRWGTPDRGVDKSAVLGPLLTQEGRVYDVRSPDLPTIRR